MLAGILLTDQTSLASGNLWIWSGSPAHQWDETLTDPWLECPMLATPEDSDKG